MTRGSNCATKPPTHPEDGDGVSSQNIGRPSDPDEAVCPRKFHWILLPRNLQDLFNHICLSACQHLHGRSWCPLMDFCEIRYLNIFKKSIEKIQVTFKSNKNNRNLHADLHTFMKISCCIRLRMWNVSDISFRQNQYTHFMLKYFFFFFF